MVHIIAVFTVNITANRWQTPNFARILTFGVRNLQLNERILSGNLPCPKEQAAFLASIQLTIEKELLNPRRTQEGQGLRQQLAKGQFGGSFL